MNVIEHQIIAIIIPERVKYRKYKKNSSKNEPTDSLAGK
jgi:hypothetical protein